MYDVDEIVFDSTSQLQHYLTRIHCAQILVAMLNVSAALSLLEILCVCYINTFN